MKCRKPQDAVWHHPVDDLEPEEDILSDAAEMLSDFLRALSDCKTATEAGREAVAHIALAMPECFPGGAKLPRKSLQGSYKAFGIAFSRLFSCIMGGWGKSPVREVGIRAIAAVYVLRPDLLGAATMETLGRKFGPVTRQAFCKHVRSIRDAHGGIRNRAMKSEETRAKLKQRTKHDL